MEMSCLTSSYFSSIDNATSSSTCGHACSGIVVAAGIGIGILDERFDALHQGLLPVPQRHDLIGVARGPLFLEPVDLPLHLRPLPHVAQALQGAYAIDWLGGGVRLAADLLDQNGFSFT